MAVSAPDHGDDGALVRAVQAGDVDCFGALFRRHYAEVRRACARRLGDVNEADEVAQAAFVRALERIDQCGGDHRFGPWVHVIARSLCMDAFRARARVEPFEQPLAGRHELRSNEPEDSVLDRELVAQVREALATLPDRQRRAVIARDWDGLRPGEIAERLGLSVGAVDSLLLRARRRLALSYHRLAGEGGRVAGTLPLRSAATAVGVTLIFAPGAVMAGTVAAASAVQGTAGRAAGGVVAAAVSVAVSLGVAAPPADAPPPQPPAAVVTVATVDGPAAPRPPSPPVSARHTDDPSPAPAQVPVAVPTGPPTVPVHDAALDDPPGAAPEAAAESEPATPAVQDVEREPAEEAVAEQPDEGGLQTEPPPAPPVAVDVPPVAVDIPAVPPLPDLPVPTVRLGSGRG